MLAAKLGLSRPEPAVILIDEDLARLVADVAPPPRWQNHPNLLVKVHRSRRHSATELRLGAIPKSGGDIP